MGAVVFCFVSRYVDELTKRSHKSRLIRKILELIMRHNSQKRLSDTDNVTNHYYQAHNFRLDADNWYWAHPVYNCKIQFSFEVLQYNYSAMPALRKSKQLQNSTSPPSRYSCRLYSLLPPSGENGFKWWNVKRVSPRQTGRKLQQEKKRCKIWSQET